MANSDALNYTLGLDIGVTSIGWALLDFENEKIIKIGVRKFEEPRVPKTGATLSTKRREKRSLRRTIRRKAFRKDRLLRRLETEGIISKENRQAVLLNSKSTSNIFYTPKGSRQLSSWQLRAEGLQRKLSDKEWARVLYHLTKHRGYQSNSIEKKKEAGKNSDAGLLLGGIASISKELQDFTEEHPDKPHSVGEMFYTKYPNKKRNSDGQYSRTVGREEILSELTTLFECQRSFGNQYTSKEFQTEIESILNARRNFSQGPGGDSPYGGNLIERMVGQCTLDPSQKRAPKDSPTSIDFRLHQALNNIRVGNLTQQNIRLTQEEKELAAEKASSIGKFTYSHLRKAISLEENLIFKGLRYNLSFREIMSIIYSSDPEFYKESIKGTQEVLPQIAAVIERDNLISKKDKIHQLMNQFKMPEKVATKLASATDNPEGKTIVDQSHLRKIEKILSNHELSSDQDQKEEIVKTLTLFKEDAAFNELIAAGIPEKAAEDLAMESFSEFMNLSVTVMKKLIPHLINGAGYDEACAMEGFNHAQSQINRDNVTNPTVFRAFKQTQKVIKTITRKYGTPQRVCLEVARDLSRNKKEKDKLQKMMDENESRRRIEESHFVSEMGRNPVGRESQIWRFYKEQNGQCLYCGKPLGDLNSIFAHMGSPEAEIEHTLPYSRSFDNRQCNKTATCTTCNRNKGNKTPFEFFGTDKNGKDWLEFKARCSMIKDRQKRELLLTTDWDEEGSGERQLNDTRYITRLVQSWLENTEEFKGKLIATAEKGQERTIYAVKGTATSVLRKIWQLERFKYNEDKIRVSEKNHALDAAVVAAATVRQNQIISEKNRKRELQIQEDNEFRPSKGIQKLIPQPWPTFSQELLAFYGYHPNLEGLNNDPNAYMNLIDGASEKYKIEENPLEPLFISWMPKRSVKGSIHKETIYRVKTITEEETDKKGITTTKEKDIYLKRIPLENLNYKNLELMAGAYDSMTGEKTPLYTALKERLDQHGGDAKKAFKEPFRKGQKTNAPIVKKIRIREEMGGGMRVQNGAAENGDMIRVDVFRRVNAKGDAKYFLIPIYTKHRSCDDLPTRAIVAHKPESEWDIVENKEFICSLYPNDYIQVEKKKDGWTEGYYVGTHRGTAKITLHPADSRNDHYVSVKTGVLNFKKLHIDILGNKTEVHFPEKRVPLRKPGQNG